MKRSLPAYVYAKGRKGYLYFCRRGAKPIRMYQKPGTAEFAAEYAMLLRGRQPEPNRTVKGLIASYVASDRWGQLAPNTQRSYRRHFRYFEEVMGAVDPRTLRRVHINEMRDALAETPTDASRKVGALSVLFEHGIDKGWMQENPAKGVALLKGKRAPRQPWPEDMVQAFRDAADTRTRLIFELLLGTGQRIGDVLAMQWGHIEDEGITVRQGKTKRVLWVPFTATVKRILAETPRRGLHIVTQENGRPVSYSMAHRDIMLVRKAIGAEAWDIHALRHSAASEIAALPGMTSEHVMAITGHSAVGMALHYSKAAMQKARAREAQKGRK